MPEITKEELGVMIENKATAAAVAAGAEITERMKDELKEMVQDAVKDVGTNDTPSFEETHPQVDPKGGFYNEAEFAKAIYDAGPECAGIYAPKNDGVKKLAAWYSTSNTLLAEESKAAGSPSQNVTSLEAGGMLIPPEYSRTSLSRAQERSNIMANAMIVPMATNVITIPYVNSFNESQGLSAGNVKFRWLAEEAQDTGNQVQFKGATLTLKEASALVYVSNQMMDFSPVSIQPFITKGIDNALDLALSNAFLNGTGAGQPQGVLSADCVVEVAKEVGQDADTIVYENTLKMFARGYGNGQWYGNKNIYPQLGVMQVAVGTGGSAVFISGSNASGAPLMTLHGLPLNLNNVSPILGDAGDLALIDWSQYLIGQLAGKSGLITSESAHLKFDYRQHAFQFSFYIDGKPWWPEAFQPLKGDSQSPVVTLAARA